MLAQLPDLVMRSVDSLGKMVDAADKAGVSLADLQKLTFAGIGSGTGQDQIVSMMEMFNKRIGEAAIKGGELKDLLDANGVSLRDANGTIRSNVELLGIVADLVKNARTEQEATVIATLALGKSGAELLPFLKQGSAEMAKLGEAAKASGFVIDDDLIKASDEFGDKWSQRIAAWKAEFMSAIDRVAVDIDTSLTKAGDLSIAQLEVRAGELRKNIATLQKSPVDRLFHAFPGGLDDQLKELEDAERRVRELGGAASKENVSVASKGIQDQIAAAQKQADVLHAELNRVTGEGDSDLVVSAVKRETDAIDAQIAKLKERLALLQSGGAVARNHKDEITWPVPTTVPLQGPKFGPERPPAGWKPEFDKSVDSLQKQIALIEAHTAALGLSVGAQARANAEAQITNDLAEKNISVVGKQKTELDKYLDQLQAVTDAQKAAVDKQAGIAEASSSINQDIEQGLNSILDGTNKVGDALLALLKKIELEIIDSALFGTGPFSKLMGTAGQNGMPGGAIGGLVGKLFGGAAGNAAPATAGQQAANAGPAGGLVAQLLGGYRNAGQGSGVLNPANQNITPVSSTGSNPFLDLIGRAEGTDKGRGYNETLGYGAFTGGPRELTSMSLDQVRELQRKMLANPANTFNSSAVGRYQITGRTLDGLKAKMGLNGSELFDPAMQDRLAMSLAQQRGPDVGGLRNEWEGLRGVASPDILAAYQQQIASSGKALSTTLTDTASAAAAGSSDFIGSFGSSLSSILNALGGTNASGSGQQGGGGLGGLLSSLMGSGGAPAGAAAVAPSQQAGGGILAMLAHIFGFADGGGPVKGPGTGRSDSIVARLSAGEFVVNAKAAEKFGPLLAHINDNHALPRFADGGMVGPHHAPVMRAPVAAGGGQGPVVIHNYGPPIHEEQRAGRNGSQELHLIVGRVLDERLPGTLNKIMPQQFGLRPVMAGRT